MEKREVPVCIVSRGVKIKKFQVNFDFIFYSESAEGELIKGSVFNFIRLICRKVSAWQEIRLRNELKSRHHYSFIHRQPPF